MTATTHDLTNADWSDLGAADDCTLQLKGDGVVIFTTSTGRPAQAIADGLSLSSARGCHGDATVQKAGRNLWARSGTRRGVTVVVER